MSDKTFATGVVLLYPVDDDQPQAWIDRATDAPRAVAGFNRCGWRRPVADCSPRCRHPRYGRPFACLAGFGCLVRAECRRRASEVLRSGDRGGPAVAARHRGVRHDVTEDRADDFVATQHQIAASTAQYPGYIATVLLPLAPEAGIEQWTSILCFRTDNQLAAWSNSDERARRLEQLRTHLTKDFDTLSVDATFGSILRIDHDDAVAVSRPGPQRRWRATVAVDVAEPDCHRRRVDLRADAAGNQTLHSLAGSDRRRVGEGVDAGRADGYRGVCGDAMAVRRGAVAGFLASRVTIRPARCSHPPTAAAARSARGTTR
jgi:heme-degrading monooxygenase HmoA